MTDDPAAGRQHPEWCDPAECTANKGGPHSSTVMTLGPLPHTGLIIRANLCTVDGVPVPAAMISFHSPVCHPEDVAMIGAVEDISSLVLPPDQIALLSTFLGGLHHLVDA